MTLRSGIGDAPKRREDLRFVTGRGRYLDDIAFDGLAHAVVLRSPHAHARIDGIDADSGARDAGVLAVLTAAEAAADGLSPLRPGAETNTVTGEPFAFEPQPLLAADKVRYVGEAVALIVAETRDQALDAAELVAVDYAPLPAVTTAAAARAAGAPLIADKAPGNLCLDWRHGDSRRSKPPSPRRRMSSRCGSTTTASSPTRWSRAASSAPMTRRPAATRPMSRRRASTRRAITPPARSACRRRRCGLSRPMSAAASAPRISSIPSMR